MTQDLKVGDIVQVTPDKDKAAFKSWLAWYSSPPENWNEKYGDAFVWTAQENALLQQRKEKNTCRAPNQK